MGGLYSVFVSLGRYPQSREVGVFWNGAESRVVAVQVQNTRHIANSISNIHR